MDKEIDRKTDWDWELETDFLAEIPAIDKLAMDLDAVHELFMEDAYRAFSLFRNHNDWIKVADEIWKAFAHYIGFRNDTKQDEEKERVRLISEFRKNTRDSFIGVFEVAVRPFYKLPKDVALRILTRIEGKLQAVKDFESIACDKENKELKKLDFFINRISDEIKNHERREKDDLLKAVADAGYSCLPIKSFEEFCFMKIEQMADEVRVAFLSINRGDGAYYDIGIQWMNEYNGLSGKRSISSYKSPLSRAKKRYQEMEKS